MLRKFIFGTPQPSKSTYEFKLKNSFEKRKQESQRIREKHKGRIPIIVEKSRPSELPDINKTKYLVPDDLTVAQLMYVIRSNMDTLSSNQTIFLFIANSTIASCDQLIKEIDKKHRDQDGFLYITYAAELAFG